MFFALTITLLRIAEFFIIPEWSPITPAVIFLAKYLYPAFEDLYHWTIEHIWIPILHVVLQVTPMICDRGLLLWIIMAFYDVAWMVW